MGGFTGLIHIDVLSNEDNNIRLNGEYTTVAYEIAKAIASYLVVYVNSKDDNVRQNVIDYLSLLMIQYLLNILK